MGGRLSVDLASTDMEVVLNKLIQGSDHGHFRVEKSGNAFHVVPTETRNRDGNWLPQNSILDVSITLPLQDRTAFETIKAICQAVSAASHVHVEVGTGIWSGRATGVGGPAQYRLGANDEQARSVLLRALAVLTPPGVATKQTWLLFYGSPQDPAYSLNLIAVPGPTVKEPARSLTPQSDGQSAASVN
jgi:hypothetical protein